MGVGTTGAGERGSGMVTTMTCMLCISTSSIHSSTSHGCSPSRSACRTALSPQGHTGRLIKRSLWFPGAGWGCCMSYWGKRGADKTCRSCPSKNGSANLDMSQSVMPANMPHPSHRLDVLLVPTNPDRLWEESTADAVIEALRDFEEPRVRRVRLDQPGRGVLYGNQQGGFRVSCPADGRPMAARIPEALRRWQLDGQRGLVCECGDRHQLEDMDYRPPAAPGRCALVLEDVSSYVLDDGCVERLREKLGPFRVVARRVG